MTAALASVGSQDPSPFRAINMPLALTTGPVGVGSASFAGARFGLDGPRDFVISGAVAC
jgi:hypothetical protein